MCIFDIFFDYLQHKLMFILVLFSLLIQAGVTGVLCTCGGMDVFFSYISPGFNV